VAKTPDPHGTSQVPPRIEKVTTTVSTTTAVEKKKAKQARAKARRKARLRDKAVQELYKPLEEWDEDEMAHGRPKAADGTFRGRDPKWITRQVHEEAIRRFKDLSQAELRAIVPEALKQLRTIVTCDDTDEDGKRLVPMSTKLDAIKFTVEHLLGKPTARVEMDISARLQAMLGVALVNPDGQPAISVQSWEQSDDEEEPDGA
jgi:hypothetical protein